MDCFVLSTDVSSETDITPIHICRSDTWESLRKTFTPAQQVFAKARQFNGETGQRVQVPGESGEIACVLFGAGNGETDALGALRMGTLSKQLPAGIYRIQTHPEDWTKSLMTVGWGLGAYKFDRYLKETITPPVLILADDYAHEESMALVTASHNGRDLINTPAGDMGPVNLHKAAEALAQKYDADVTATIGEDLLAQNLPMIHAVGRAAHESPRLVELRWGDKNHPALALIGKGITFDTGGVNMKSASGARIMKKDMGGAAHAIALAEMIMANNLPICLHVLLSIAENSVSSNAYRPGDILTSRAGLTVEIDNTDAEGRLVLADALTKAVEEEPDLMIDFATLTGAARVALGPDLPPFFSNRDAPVSGVLEQGKNQNDPFWHMPLWQPYNTLLSCPIADMKNAGGGFAGAVTAALFLERFVKGRPWMHFDVYGWNPNERPAHPKGGEVMTVRALYHWLKEGGLNGDFSA